MREGAADASASDQPPVAVGSSWPTASSCLATSSSSGSHFPGVWCGGGCGVQRALGCPCPSQRGLKLLPFPAW